MSTHTHIHTFIHGGTSQLWLVSISDEGSLPEIALSGASKLPSTYFTLLYRSVHVLYAEIHNPVAIKGKENGKTKIIALIINTLYY